MGLIVLTALVLTGALPLPIHQSPQSLRLEEWKKLQCEGRSVRDRYVNYAEGFSVGIPRELEGRAGQAAGPERGVSIPLSADCQAVVVIFGQPNALEWATPEAAIDRQVELATEDDPKVQVVRYAATLGSRRAAGVTLRSEATRVVDDVVVAFRPGGERVYFARLSTTADRYARDRQSFMRIIRGFRLEEWR